MTSVFTNRSLAFVAAAGASMLLFAGGAIAQCSKTTANAVGIWRSDSFKFEPYSIPVPGGSLPYAAGTARYSVWQVLPAELCTYFRCGNGNRELDFRAVEFNVSYTSAALQNYDSPKITITDILMPVPATPTRCCPVPNAPGLTFWPTPNFITGGSPGCHYRVYLKKGGPPYVVSPGTAGLAFVWEDYEIQYGQGNSLQIDRTTMEPAATLTDADNSFSGYTIPTIVGGSLVYAPTTMPNFGTVATPLSGEFCVTWYFDQSMIQPIKNAHNVTGAMPGGGVAPASIVSISGDDGRGALFPFKNDIISYMGNTHAGFTAAGSGGFSNTTFLIPLVFYSGFTIPPIFDPNPENWKTGPAFIYSKTVTSWLSDLGVNNAASYDPNKCYLGLWLGVDLAAPLIDASLVNFSLTFTDISAATPTYCMYGSITNPGGPAARNLVNTAGSPYCAPFNGLGKREHRTFFTNQSGMTPLSNPTIGTPPFALPPGEAFVGLGQDPASLPGQTFGIQCLVLDANTFKFIDTTNVALMRAQ
ncbi:MAG: hypothetical protein HY286_13975 [Planctomycetes bacterium]|nr:hypothetical protein [Planctomycetota bacterium]